MHKGIRAFLAKAVGEYDRTEKLTGDASFREYFRIYSKCKSYILCVDKSFLYTNEKEHPFCNVHALFTQRKIPVPRLLSTDNKNGLLLLEDVGNDLMEFVVPRLTGSQIRTTYKRLVDILLTIQLTEKDEKWTPFHLCFDVPKLMFEFEFFIEHALLGYFHAKIKKSDLQTLRIEFHRLSGILYRPDSFVLNHRDFHSRNVLLFHGRPFLIDFQDARMGLPQYDAVSLLRDSYTVLGIPLVRYLMEYHFRGLYTNGYDKMTFDEYQYYFDIMAFQRNIKALGTFGYQVMALGRKQYEKYIPVTLRYIWEYAQRRDDLKQAGALLHTYLGSVQ